MKRTDRTCNTLDGKSTDATADEQVIYGDPNDDGKHANGIHRVYDQDGMMGNNIMTDIPVVLTQAADAIGSIYDNKKKFYQGAGVRTLAAGAIAFFSAFSKASEHAANGAHTKGSAGQSAPTSSYFYGEDDVLRKGT